MTVSIEQLGATFQGWRSQCKQPGRVPEHLKIQTIKCLEDYSYTQVSAATGLSLSTLYTWSPKDSKAPSTESINFIPLEVNSEQLKRHKTQQPCIPISLQLTLLNGIKATLLSDEPKQLVDILLYLARGEH